MEKQIWNRKSTVAFMKRSHCTHLPLKISETLNRACHLVSLFCSHSYCVINHFCEICSLFIETNQPFIFQTVLKCAQMNLTLFTMLFLAKQHLHDARRWDISYVFVCLAQWALQNAAGIKHLLRSLRQLPLYYHLHEWSECCKNTLFSTLKKWPKIFSWSFYFSTLFCRLN